MSAPASTLHATGAEIESIEGVRAAAPLRAAWNELVERGPGEVSLTYEWLLALEESHFPDRPLRIAACRTGGALATVWPLVVQRGRFCKLPARKLALATNTYCNHNDLICGPGGEGVEDSLRLLSAAVGPWDVLELDEVQTGSPRMAALETACAALGCSVLRKHKSRSPRIPLGGDFDTIYKALRPGDTRRKIRKLEERLQALPGYRLRVFSAPGEAREAVELVLDIERNSWKARERTDIASHPEQVAFYSRLAELAAERGWLAIAAISTESGPLAYEYNLHFAGRCFHLKGSYHAAHRELSPAKVLKKEVLRDCCERGLAEYDYTGQEQEHKLEWTDQMRDHEHWMVFNSPVYPRLLSRVGPYGRW